jgi:hypothetical protein
VSIFEGIVEVFQDAHFSKKVSTFEPGEHLRQGRAPALHPVPFSRKVVLPLVSASIASLKIREGDPGAPGEPHSSRSSLKRLGRSLALAYLVAGAGRVGRFVSMRRPPWGRTPNPGPATKKAVPGS